MSNPIYSESILRSMATIRTLREVRPTEKQPCRRCNPPSPDSKLCSACFAALPWMTRDILNKKYGKVSA